MQFVALIAITAIALSPIAHAMGMVSDLVASVGFYGGLAALSFGLGTVLDDWLSRLEQQAGR